MGRKSIFDLECRVDLMEGFRDLEHNMSKMMVTCSNGSVRSIFELLDQCIRSWPFRDTAMSICKYLEYRGIDQSELSKEDVISVLELYINLLHWLPVYDRTQTGFITGFDSDVAYGCGLFLQNIGALLEKCNWTVREKEVKDHMQYRITKRDAGVDAALEQVPELAETLLEYLDLRNAKDLEAKRRILKTVADAMESIRTEYKGTVYDKLCENVFFVFNRCSIRHSAKQIKMTKARQMKVYDQTFRACIHLLQKEDMQRFKETAEELKKL